MENSKRFVLFKNDYKTEGSKQPDYKGFIYFEDGSQQELSGWVNENDKGKYLSGSWKEMYIKPEVGQSGSPTDNGHDNGQSDNSDLPF